MNTKSAIFFRILLNRFNPQNQNNIVKFLPVEESKQVMNQDIQSNDVNPLLNQPYALINWIDHSWKEPFIAKFPTALQPLVQESVSNQQASAPTVSGLIKQFFIHQCYQYFGGEKLIPINYLPEIEFSPLLKMSKHQLIRLATFLGLYDLASEMQLIVNKVQIKNLYECLTPQESYYLQVCLNQKDRLVYPKLGIDFSVNDPVKVKKILHQRGLIRLTRGLAGQNPDFIWYISRRYDTGRGKIFLHYYRQEVDPTVTPILKSQVLSLMKYLSKE